MAKLKFGVIGAGMVSRGAVKSILKHDDATIVAAWDPHAGRLAELKEEGKITRTHETLDKFLNDDEVEAVYVAVPNKYHAETALAVLNSGRHCVLDKPFALSYAEAKRVVDKANEVGKTFMLGMNQRFTADRQRVRRLVKDGVLGEVYHTKGFWLRRGGIPKLNTWFGHNAISGGGCMLDIGVHMLDVTMWMADNFRPVSVTGRTYSKFGHRGIGEGSWGMSDPDPKLTFDVDDFASALINFENGMTLALDISWAALMENDSRMGSQLFGTEAGASVDPAKLHRLGRGAAAAEAVADGTDPNQADVSKSVFETLTIGDEGSGAGPQEGSIGVPVEFPHCDRFHNFINAVLGREEKCCLDHEVLTVQKILDGIYESSRTGKQVSITPEEPR
ncbi:MAG: Gfo/Idh/MocA family protein [Phycisphaerae bacterium]